MELMGKCVALFLKATKYLSMEGYGAKSQICLVHKIKNNNLVTMVGYASIRSTLMEKYRFSEKEVDMLRKLVYCTIK